MVQSTVEIIPKIGIAPYLAEGFHNAFSGVAVGNSDPRFGDVKEVKSTRRTILSGMPMLNRTYVIKPLNETDFVDVDQPNPRIAANPDFSEIEVSADAMVTTRPRTGLMLNSADCTPLALYEADRKILALVHLGWRGAVARFQDKVLDYMREEYGLKPENTVAYMGPSIRPYEAQSLNDTWENDPDWQPHITEDDDCFQVDIPGFIERALIKYGLNPSGSIAISDIDTGHPNPMEHFSFTRHKNEGARNARNSFVTAMV